MPIDVRMPSFSTGMESANLVRWLKAEGDLVKAGDVLAEIETDKAMMELEAAHDGALAKILVPAGSSEVAVDTVIAHLETAAERAQRTADGAPAAPPPAVAREQRVIASPRARRLAVEAQIDLRQLRGSGPGGRIIERDVLGATSAGMSPMTSTATPPSYAQEVPHDAMRRTIARRTLEAKRTIPHIYLSVDCELDALLAVRETLNSNVIHPETQPSYKLSINDFMIKALALALMRVPEANVSWD